MGQESLLVSCRERFPVDVLGGIDEPRTELSREVIDMGMVMWLAARSAMSAEPLGDPRPIERLVAVEEPDSVLRVFLAWRRRKGPPIDRNPKGLKPPPDDDPLAGGGTPTEWKSVAGRR